MALAMEPTVTALAIALAPLKFFGSSAFFFTFSDFLFAISFLLLLAGRRLPLDPLGGLTWIWFLGFCLVSAGLVISSLSNENPLRGLIITLQYFFSVVVLAFVLLGRDRAVMIRHLKVFVASIFAIEAIGILAYFTGWDPTGRMVSGSKRLMSLIGEAQPNACMIAMAIPLALYLWLSRNLSHFFAIGIVFPVLVTALILTSSVTGLAAAGLAAAVYVTATFKASVLGRAALIGGVLLTVFAIAGPEMLPRTFQRRVLTAVETGDIESAGTFTSRLMLMREAIEVIHRNPLIGVGADEFRRISTERQPVHNIYLLLWVEGGLLALTGWLLLLFTSTVSALVIYFDSRFRLMASAAFAVVAAFAFIGFNTPHMYGRFWLVPLLLSVGLCLSVALADNRSIKISAVRRS